MTKDIVPIVDPSLKDPRIKTKFVEANGLRFEVDYCGTGPKLMLCLHGFPEHSFSWRYQLPMLADMGYTVWAPNMRCLLYTSPSPRDLRLSRMPSSA